MKNQKSTFIYELLLFFSVILWSSTFALIKPILPKTGVPLFISIRFSIGGTILAVFLILIKRFKPTKQTFIGGIVTGALFLIAYIMQTYGLHITTVSKNAFLVGTNFIFVPVILTLFRGIRQKRETWISVILALIGLALLTLDTKQGGINFGDIITGAGTFFVALYIIKIEDYANKVDSMTFTAFQLMTIGYLAFPISIFTTDFNFKLSSADYWSLVLLILGCTSLAYLIANYCQKYIPSTRTSLIYTFEPVFGAVFAWILLNEQVGFQAIIGMIIITFAAFYPNLIKKYFYNNRTL